jgi:hypothetical protein
MKRYSWTSAYVAAIEEHDYAELQIRIGLARKMMTERFFVLMNRYMTTREYEEFRKLRDAHGTLELLEVVSNGGNLFELEAQRKSA